MKRFLFLLTVLFLTGEALFAGAVSYQVSSGASVTTIQGYMSAAVSAGNTDITLQFAKGGTWGTSGSDIIIAVPAGVTKLTLTYDPATSGATPILYLNTLTYADALMTGGITFDGVKVMTGVANRYLIQPTSSTATRIPASLTIKNCWVEGYRAILYSTLTTTTSEFVLVNNFIKNIAAGGIISVNNGFIPIITIRNNTFSNVGGDASGTLANDYFIDFRSANSVSSQINFSNNTIFYPRTQGRGLFRTSGNFTTGYLKENNNLYATQNSTSFALQLLYNNLTAGTSTDLDSTNYYSNRMTLGSNKGNIHTTVYVENDPSNLFVNPSVDNFTINDPNFPGKISAGNPNSYFPATVNITGSNLVNFNYNVGSGPSSPQTLSLSTIALRGPVTLTAPEHYEISINNSTYTGVLEFGGLNNDLTNQTIYARLKSGLSIGTYNESITVSTAQATNQSVTCSGSVTNVLPVLDTPTGLGFSNVTYTGFQATWSAIPNASGYTIRVLLDGSAVQTITGISGTSRNVTGLTPGNTYTFAVTAVGDAVNYNSSTESSPSASFTTPFIYLNTSINIPAAGTVTKNPNTSTYSPGTTVVLSATRNFGYNFVKWVDTDTNSDIAATSSIEVTMDGTKNIQAVFVAVTTYNFTLNTSGSQWGEVSLSPTPTGGKYETGTIVTMTVVPNAVTNFVKWDDESTSTTKVVTMDGDKTFTASFDEIPFIVGWNFKNSEPRSNRVGDFYASSSNKGLISMFEPSGTTVNWLANTGFTPSYTNVRIWTSAANFLTTRRYFRAQFSTSGKTNIQVKSKMGGNYQCYAVQKLQYSLDGTNYTDLNTVDITSVYNSGWRDLDATLPVAAEDQSVVYLKWIADDTSTRLGSSDQNDGTALTHIYVYADDVVVVDEDAPQLLSTVPAQNATTASASGSITLTFDERVQAGSGNSTLGSVVLSPSFGSKTATFSYSGLTYNTDYTFTVPSGAIQDLSGNPFAGITLNFRTMNRPTPAAKTFDYIVAADGSGNGLTIQSAFDAVPTNNATPFLIFVKNGTYNEYPSLPSNKAKVSLIGQSRDGVIISGSRYSGLVDNGVTYSTSTCQTLEILASDFYGENFTVRNTAGVNAGQAVALKSYGDKNAFKNVKLLGYQDTHLTGTGRQLYKSCDIRGTVDFIFGDGDVFFDECLLYCEGRSGGDVITAPSTGASLAWGYVFNNCTIDGDATTQNNNYYLGRPWQNAPRAVYINTTMNIMPHSAGWTKMAVSPALFAEYNSVNASLQPIDLSNRKSSYTKDESNGGGTTTGHQTVLSGVEAAEYTMENVLKGLDNWNPLLKTDVTAAPTHVRVNASGEIIWDEVSYAISYLVLKNNVVITNTSNLTYTDGSYTGTDIYSVMAVAEYGALSSSSQATTSSATDHFRSFASGNWNEADSWESSSDNSGWNVATLSPTNAAASVKIMAGHLITVSTESTSSGLSVQPGAKLSIATGQTLNITGNLLLESSSIATASFVNAGTCSVSGTSSVQQYFASGRNWYFASPVSNATSAVIKSSPGNQLWERNVSANSWTEITTSNVDFTPLKGYVGKLAESGIVTFTGNINNGNVPALTLTSYGVASGKFHLVGNPYPSYLDWQAVVAANPNVMPTLWFRTKTGTDTYTFATVLMSDGVAIPATNNANTSITKFIPPMQAFWVRINDGTASANFTVNNSMRSHADVSGNRFKAPVTSPQLLRLEVTNGTHSDEAVIYFNQNASDAFDRYDAPKMFNNNAAIPEIFTRAGNERLVINGLNGVNFGTIVPLGFQSGQANSFSIRASDLQNFDADMRIILIDRASNREFNLTYGESYEFTAEAGTTEERFSVQFKSASGTTANDDALTGKVFVSSSQGKLMLQLNTEISNASVTVFNATGQSIHSQEVNTHLTVINKTLNAGAYLVKVENGGRSVVLRTIIN